VPDQQQQAQPPVLLRAQMQGQAAHRQKQG
jgi:hypothetical protein